MATSPRTCGTCTFCCKVLAIAELEKPIGQWCVHCRPGQGCGVYDSRPGPCRTYVCGWLFDASMPEALRPDRCKVAFGGDADGQRLIARCDPANPLAWRAEPVRGYLRRMAARLWRTDKSVYAVAGPRMWLITPAGEHDLGAVPPGASIRIGKRPDGHAEVEVLAPA
jgi:hypothetical protein